MKKIYIVIGMLFLISVIGSVIYTVVKNKNSTNNEDISAKKETDTVCSDSKPCPENQTCISGECKTTYFCGNCEPKQAP